MSSKNQKIENNNVSSVIFAIASICTVLIVIAAAVVYFTRETAPPVNQDGSVNEIVDDATQDIGQHKVMKPSIPDNDPPTKSDTSGEPDSKSDASAAADAQSEKNGSGE